MLQHNWKYTELPRLILNKWISLALTITFLNQFEFETWLFLIWAQRTNTLTSVVVLLSRLKSSMGHDHFPILPRVPKVICYCHHHTLSTFCILIWMFFTMEYSWRTSNFSNCLSFELQQDVSVVTLCFSHAMGHCRPTSWCQSLRSGTRTGPNTSRSTLPFSFVTNCHCHKLTCTTLRCILWTKERTKHKQNRTKKTMNSVFHIYLY
jgi:hypothetical protein